jgi:hypothetical protein
MCDDILKPYYSFISLMAELEIIEINLNNYKSFYTIFSYFYGLVTL